ncbi:MAG: hypothetical protein WEA10_08885 [Actinomycetota bacterium]
MEDFAALASRIAVSFNDLRGVLIVSRDGLVLGAFPPDAEQEVKPAWLRFATLGDSDKGFLEFADELWVYVRRGPYGAFALGGTSIRPGLLIDQLDQALLQAEEGRSKKDALKIPEAPTAPSGKPRTSLHKESKAPVEEAATPEPAAAVAEGAVAEAGPAPTGGGPESATPAAGGGAPEPAQPAASASDPVPAQAPKHEDDPAPASAPASPPAPDDDSEVDRVLLAQEFSRLLQETSVDDEES